MTRYRNSISHDYNGNVTYSLSQSWEIGPDCKSARPRTMQVYNGSGSSDFYGSTPLQPQPFDPATLTNQGISQASASIQSALADSATWANNALEAESTANSIGSACNKLMGFAKALDRGAPKSYLAGLLGLTNQVTKWGKAKNAGKSFGDAWLTWHFGWSPLADDIGAAMSNINSPAGFTRTLRGRATNTSDYYSRVVDSTLTVDRWQNIVKVLVQCNVTLTSPILSSLNNLGFVNPLSVAWEAVPYSFVVDWFTNVGQFLGQSTMMEGFSVGNPFWTQYSIGSRVFSSVARIPTDPSYDYHGACNNAYINRHLGLPSVPLVWKPFKGFSAARGATAAALLGQFLKR